MRSSASATQLSAPNEFHTNATATRASANLVLGATAAGIVVFGIGLLIGYAYGTHDAFFVTNSSAAQLFGRSAFGIGCLGLGAGPAVSWWFSRSRSTLAAAIGLAVAPMAIALWLAGT